MRTPRFFYIETFGCSANYNNSEIIKGLLRDSGLEITSNVEIADILILNTCIVKDPTEKKIERRISDLLRLEKPMIIAGCMPEVRSENLKKLEKVYLLGTHHYKDIVNLIQDIFSDTYDSKKYLSYKNEIKLCIGKLRQSKTIGITQISEGCLGSCNYCLTRFAKGKLFSYPEDKIIENVKKDIKDGCREIWISSQDNASYGLDNGKRELPKLLKKILKLEGKFYVRIGMMNPNNVLPILDELIEIYKNAKMFKFLHIPLQSGSDNILEKMNRFYSVKDFLYIVNKFKKEIPDITISTDIIVAYPDEGRKDFQETLDVLKKTLPDVLNISKYWAMKGTQAEKEKQIDVQTSIKRAKEIIRLHYNLLKDKNKKFIDWQGWVLVDEYKNKNYIARNFNYRPIVLKTDKKNLLGKFVNVKITDVDIHYFVGKIIEKDK